MPSMPSTTRSARADDGGGPGGRPGAPARRPAGARRGPAACTRSGSSRTAVTRAPRRGEGGAGEQGVAAVVARPDEQGDATPVGRAEQPQAHRGQAGGRPLHERALGQGRQQRLLRGPDLGAVCSPITRARAGRAGKPSATTTAEAMPPSWLREMCKDVTPSCAARPATVPRTSRCGRPCSPTVTSASCQCRSPGAPSALASASLAANRAARDSPVRAVPDGVCCSAAVNSRSRSPVCA